jgi:hypothetical protein
MKSSAIVVLVLLIAVVSGGFFYFKDTQGPQLVISPDTGPVSDKRPLLVTVEDPSGIRRLTVTLSQGELSTQLIDQIYEQGTTSRQEEILLEKGKWKDGQLELHVSVTDRSVYRFGRGNSTEQSFSFTYDTRPPVVSVLSTAHNMNRGGAGVIVYTINEEPGKTGVQVGDRFFPGHRQTSGTYAAFFALPYDMIVTDFSPRLIAIDLAGNERQVGFSHHVNNRTFPRDRINITPQFLEAKMPEFQPFFPETTDLFDLFLRVNRELREANRKKLLEIGRKTAATPQWEGAFLSKTNSSVHGRFAEHRTYFYQGKKVDEQVHLGIDLASVAQAPVPAANHGTVVFADDLGIYGQCVIIDHGVGLQTLYGHLSAIEVSIGDRIEKGQIIGRTGMTGLAGGDHLHFDVLIAGLPVNPLEWWDLNWIRNNVTGKLSLTAENR